MAKRKITEPQSQEEFISKVLERRQDLDLSKVEYVNSHTKVKLICHEKFMFGEEHGEYWAYPYQIYKGCKCPFCDGKFLRTHEFVTKCSQFLFGDKYSIPYFEPKKATDEINIECDIHGTFSRVIKIFLRGYGCSHCNNHPPLTLDKIKERCVKIYGDKYNAEELKYNPTLKEITYKCPIHGWHTSNVQNFLNGHSCPECGYKTAGLKGRNSWDEVVTRIKAIHGDSISIPSIEYEGQHTPMLAICSKHKEFSTTPKKLLAGYGCPTCCMSHGEKTIRNWLIAHNVEYIPQYIIVPSQSVLFGIKKFKVDFYLPDFNTIIEFHGSQHYERAECWQTEEDFQNQQDRDKRLREYCKQQKIKLIEIPYTKLKEIDKILDKRIGRLK